MENIYEHFPVYVNQFKKNPHFAVYQDYQTYIKTGLNRIRDIINKEFPRENEDGNVTDIDHRKAVTVDKYLYYHSLLSDDLSTLINQNYQGYIYSNDKTPLLGFYHALRIMKLAWTEYSQFPDSPNLYKVNFIDEISQCPVDNEYSLKAGLDLVAYLIKDFLKTAKLNTDQSRTPSGENKHILENIDNTLIYKWSTQKIVSEDTNESSKKSNRLIQEILTYIESFKLNEFAFILDEGVIIANGAAIGNPFNKIKPNSVVRDRYDNISSLGYKNVPGDIVKSIETGSLVDHNKSMMPVLGQIVDYNGYKFTVDNFFDVFYLNYQKNKTDKTVDPFHNITGQKYKLWNSPDDIYMFSDELIGLSENQYSNVGGPRYQLISNLLEGLANNRRYLSDDSVELYNTRPYLNLYSDEGTRTNAISNGCTISGARDGFNMVRSLSATIKELQAETVEHANRLVWWSYPLRNVAFDLKGHRDGTYYENEDRSNYKQYYQYVLKHINQGLQIPGSRETIDLKNILESPEDIDPNSNLADSVFPKTFKLKDNKYWNNLKYDFSKLKFDEPISFNYYQDKSQYDMDPYIKNGQISFVKDSLNKNNDSIEIKMDDERSFHLGNNVIIKDFKDFSRKNQLYLVSSLVDQILSLFFITLDYEECKLVQEVYPELDGADTLYKFRGTKLEKNTDYEYVQLEQVKDEKSYDYQSLVREVNQRHILINNSDLSSWYSLANGKVYNKWPTRFSQYGYREDSLKDSLGYKLRSNILDDLRVKSGTTVIIKNVPTGYISANLVLETIRGGINKEKSICYTLDDILKFAEGLAINNIGHLYSTYFDADAIAEKRDFNKGYRDNWSETGLTVATNTVIDSLEEHNLTDGNIPTGVKVLYCQNSDIYRSQKLNKKQGIYDKPLTDEERYQIINELTSSLYTVNPLFQYNFFTQEFNNNFINFDKTQYNIFRDGVQQKDCLKEIILELCPDQWNNEKIFLARNSYSDNFKTKTLFDAILDKDLFALRSPVYAYSIEKGKYNTQYNKENNNLYANSFFELKFESTFDKNFIIDAINNSIDENNKSVISSVNGVKPDPNAYGSEKGSVTLTLDNFKSGINTVEIKENSDKTISLSEKSGTDHTDADNIKSINAALKSLSDHLIQSVNEDLSTSNPVTINPSIVSSKNSTTRDQIKFVPSFNILNANKTNETLKWPQNRILSVDYDKSKSTRTSKDPNKTGLYLGFDLKYNKYDKSKPDSPESSLEFTEVTNNNGTYNAVTKTFELPFKDLYSEISKSNKALDDFKTNEYNKFVKSTNDSITNINKTINDHIGQAFVYKGSVNNLDELKAIKDPKVGYVYNVSTDKDKDGPNYVWNGKEWDRLGGLLNTDLSNYYTKDETYNKKEVDSKITNLSNEQGKYMPLSGGTFVGPVQISNTESTNNKKAFEFISPEDQAKLTSDGGFTGSNVHKISLVVSELTRSDYPETLKRIPIDALKVKNADHAAEADHTKKADNATNADKAKLADNATEANHSKTSDTATKATNADHATNADSATTATKSDSADKLSKDIKIYLGNSGSNSISVNTDSATNNTVENRITPEKIGTKTSEQITNEINNAIKSIISDKTNPVTQKLDEIQKTLDEILEKLKWIDRG